ncbi:acyl-coenzyme A thioesterase 1-like [Pteronotus mesoamericanus]|uniref:acyl-coenzyme A thioesterase 1-like n=1 Tax=Pteronotus mesoamericanus TaxID=1884717 RepID=UPI0023EC5CAE|nr:acyl-coenzyme A thioesterase 1-like [Pteronotus parnellii mesoamericanus]
MRRWAQAAFRTPGARLQLRRSMSTASHFSQKAATLTVTPKTGLADELLDIKVEGLGHRERVTLRASAVSYRGRLFHSRAHFESDGRGGLDLARDPALGGDFTGVEPMGLLWSLTPASSKDPCLNQMPRGVLKTPLKVEVTVHPTPQQPEVPLGPALASAQVQRWFSRPELSRARLQAGRLRGVFLLPPGDGPFPGLIDMFGDGGLNESRASLLACRGFAALALPFFGYEDLPPVMKDLNLDYFEEAAKFVQSHPKVKGPNIGVIGSGKGAELAVSMASFLPNIAAVVSINGCISNTATALTCGGLILPGLPFNLDKISATDSGVYDIKEALEDPLDPAYRESRIPLEKASAHFLFIVGEDDRHWKSSLYADIAVKHLTDHGKTNFTLLSYPNAGHRIDPPYSPFFSAAWDPVLGVSVLGGGQLKAHAVAQIESWKKILEFLHLHLG